MEQIEITGRHCRHLNPVSLKRETVERKGGKLSQALQRL